MMYRFPLQALLNHRQTVEEARQKELALLETDLAGARNRLASTGAAMDRLQSELAAQQASGLAANQSWLYSAYFQRLRGELAATRRKVEAIQTACERKRAELLAAVQDRKIMEKLKEKGSRAYVEQSNRKEMQLIDEISACRHAREAGACQYGDREADI